MEIIQCSNPKALAKAVAIIKSGGTVVFPTETAYALGCDATSKKAIANIFLIKNRPVEKSLPIIVASVEMARQYAVWNDLAGQLAKKWWPGPLTLLVKARKKLPMAAPDNSLAMRVPSLLFTRELSKKAGVPLVSTSANASGGKTRYSIAGIVNDFSDQHLPDLIIDAGRLPRRKPSTIVDGRGVDPVVVRQGSIHI